ncbi:MAG TPA: 3-carboxy-cis,cis-muconate cycloisomerase [Gemmatimonadales bacterium]
MPSDRLFGPTFTTDVMADAVSDRAWVQAMLDVEAALAAAEERAGVIPAGTATMIAAGCSSDRYDIGALGRAAAEAGNPVIPLVKALTRAVPAEASGWVHWGATSQDILDTAMVLLVRRGLNLLLSDLDAIAAACARLSHEHRQTVMLGRTFLQPAVPITFGLKVAGWLVATLDARRRLAELRASGLAVQLGGAAGTLASLGADGPRVVRLMAEELALAEPVVPWHSARGRIAEVGAALGVTCGVMGKIARDVALLMQAEVGEVAEPTAPGRGGSSSMPHKQNPVAAMAVEAGVRRAHALVGVLLGAMLQEHERAVGGWHAEWETVGELFRLSAGAVVRVRDVVDRLHVDPVRMRANLDATHGLPLSEHLALLLARLMGRGEARALVERAIQRCRTSGRHLRDELLADPTVTTHLTAAELDEALDPARYLGATQVFIDRALALYRSTIS